MSANCHHHGTSTDIKLEEGCKKIVLVGNPNVGKSVFFNHLTGLYVDVSNYPGTTVEIARGQWQGHQIVDTPGIYGVSSFNDEEKVARDIILEADLILNVVDATHMERDFFLTQQLIDMGKPVIVALNFSDEVEKAGLEIDIDLLHDLLGVEIVPTAAIHNVGVEKVLGKLGEARPGRQFPDLQKRLEGMLSKVGTQAEALLVLEGDVFVAEKHGVEPGSERDIIYQDRRNRVNDIIGHVLKDNSSAGSLREILGRLVVNPITGVPVLAVILYVIYKIIGVWVAGDIVGITEETIMQGHYEPWIKGLVGKVVSDGSVMSHILTGEFGLLTMTVTYLLGLLLPLVLGFYVILSIMEDSGYLPRLATLVDRLMTGVGLNGRAVIPLILGFGCVQLGTITTRLLGTNREKSIATVLLNFAVPCSAQIGVIAGMLAALGGQMTLMYGSIIFAVLAVVGTVLNRTIPGQSSALLIDLPPMRLPRIDNIIRKTITRTFFFMKEAYPWFFLGSFIVAVLQVSGGLDIWQKMLRPLTTGWLQIPEEASTAFVMGLVRRDFGAAGLTELAMSPLQVVTSLVVITLFVPCIASLMILFKERGTREALMVWGGSWVVAFLVGGLFSQIMI